MSRWLSSFHREGRKMTGDIKLNKAFLLESIMKIENLAKGRVEEEALVLCRYGANHLLGPAHGASASVLNVHTPLSYTHPGASL